MGGAAKRCKQKDVGKRKSQAVSEDGSLCSERTATIEVRKIRVAEGLFYLLDEVT